MSPPNPIRQSVSEAEHTAFGKLTEAMQLAHEAAMSLSHLREDQRNLWEKVAVNLKVMQGQLYDLASGGMFTAEDGKFGGGPTH